MVFFDLQKDADFRIGVSKRIATMSNNFSFFLPDSFPVLYKYRNMSDFAINDILEGKITLTLIGAFNDLFDGAFHMYGSESDRNQKAEEEWIKMEKLRIAAGIETPLLDHDYLTNLYKVRYKILIKIIKYNAKKNILNKLKEFMSNFGFCNKVNFGLNDNIDIGY